ncbi:MAG: hypothetical protein GWO04_34410, partial [Actinobacteria bacterium]|nr:hypothetical protein [Actinomycetota bacterium]
MRGRQPSSHAGTTDAAAQENGAQIAVYAACFQNGLSMSAAPAEAPPISVVAAVVVDDLRAVSATLDAVARQVYEPARIVVVGGDRDGRRVADVSQVEWISTLSGLLGALDQATTHVWLLSGGAEPRPDALRALVAESDRVEAGIAGSKLLSRETPERLVSV